MTYGHKKVHQLYYNFYFTAIAGNNATDVNIGEIEIMYKFTYPYHITNPTILERMSGRNFSIDEAL